MLTAATPADDTGDSEALTTPRDASAPEAGTGGVAPDAPPLDPGIRADGKTAPPRPKRDYNYFADLRTALAELQQSKERSSTADDDHVA